MNFGNSRISGTFSWGNLWSFTSVVGDEGDVVIKGAVKQKKQMQKKKWCS